MPRSRLSGGASNLNQITDFRFVGSMWVGEARKVRGRVFSEKEPTESLEDDGIL